jgi:heterodisulfide reductase subunit A-like polyferredoxin
MLGRFYAICNCCSCCCGAMQAHHNGTPMLASSGYVAHVDAELCAACGTCADYCQFAAISVDNGFACIDATACMGCGVCVATARKKLSPCCATRLRANRWRSGSSLQRQR